MKRLKRWTVPVDGMPHDVGAGMVVLLSSRGGDDEVELYVWTEEPEKKPVKTRAVRVYIGETTLLDDKQTHIGSVLHSSELTLHVYGSVS